MNHPGIGTVTVVEGRVLVAADGGAADVFFADHNGVAGTVGDRSKPGPRVPRLNHARWRRAGHLPGGGGVGLSGRVFHQRLDQDAVGVNDEVGVGVAVAGRVVSQGPGHIDVGRCSGKRNLRGVVVQADAARAPAAGTVKDGELGLADGVAVGPLIVVPAVDVPLLVKWGLFKERQEEHRPGHAAVIFHARRRKVFVRVVIVVQG